VKKRFRLKRSIDFQRVRRSGKSYSHPLVILIVLPNELEHTRVGVVASKSVGGAVERNRAKRVLRAAITAILPDTQPGHDMVLIARPPIGKAISPQVEAALRKTLLKAEMLKQSS
jgi:ribonuclease P protein component